MGHFFISYSHQDKDFVHELVEGLHSVGFEIWVDDGIDYGTRWTSVIENAIDTCDAFILVASDSSHQSEWVQHEFSRAQRLRKRIFPLLLDGGPWLGFESTQYFDVKDYKLPDEKFYTALRRFENQHLELLRDVVADIWPLYQNEEYGFSLRYPKDGILLEKPGRFVQIDLPVLAGTDLEGRVLTIYFRKDTPLQSPMIQEMPWQHQSRYVHILGLRFLKESAEEGGMSHYHDVVSYSTAHESKVVTLSFHLTTLFPGVLGLGPGVVVEVDRVAAKEILSYVVSTFTWLD